MVGTLLLSAQCHQFLGGGRVSPRSCAIAGPTATTFSFSSHQSSARGSGVFDSARGSGVADSARGSGVADSGRGSGVADSGRGSGVTDSGRGAGVTFSGRAAGVTVSGRGAGVTVSGRGDGVDFAVRGAPLVRFGLLPSLALAPGCGRAAGLFDGPGTRPCPNIGVAVMLRANSKTASALTNLIIPPGR
jgi:hypothetical protein